MRQITKDIEITVDGSPVGFRLSKLDAFSGVTLLRLLMRLENQNTAPTMLDLIASLSEDELRSVMTAVFALILLGEQLSVTGVAGALIILICIAAGAVTR